MYRKANEVYNKPSDKHVNMTWKEKKNISTKDPSVWGQACWFTLHNFAYNYPENPTPICQQRCFEFIRALPYMIPCDGCSVHAMQFIESKLNEMKNICSTKNKLFEFFVEFHNHVNKRYGKKEMSVTEALAIYESSKVKYLDYN